MTKLCALSCLSLFAFRLGVAQDETKGDTVFRPMEQVVVSYNKWEVKRNEVPNRIVKIDLRDASLQNPQTTADMLALSGRVFVQKSQMGQAAPWSEASPPTGCSSQWTASA